MEDRRTVTLTPHLDSLGKNDLDYVSFKNSFFEAVLDRISLEYTAGAPIEELKGLSPLR